MTAFDSVLRVAGIVLALFLNASTAHAIDLKALKPQGYVSDFAGVVDAESRAAVEQYAAAVEKSTGVQMSFVTLKTLEGDPLEDVNIDLFRQFGVGQKGKDNGVQLLLVTGDRRSRLEVGHGLEPVLPDGFDGQVLVDMQPELRAGHYGQAILAAAQRIGETVAKEQGVQIAAPAGIHHKRSDPEHKAPLPWGLIVFLFVILLLGTSRGRRGGGGGGFLPGLLIGSMMGGRRDDGGGGGFGGGGGSSGGFGGFGGGDAGGGGASSSW